ncbi:MAG: hypothetical protein NC485_12365 [Ruminococcus flavefaciens]|nr:hypothetical protein [Ruminococcus flavefaciens]MCM1060113.1 hypothetical protein [Eubacterium sp.]
MGDTLQNTTNSDVFNSFHSHPLTKYPIPEGLEEQWLIDAVADYSLSIAPLFYDTSAKEFDSHLPQAVIATLGQMMYCSYLVRTLDRLEQLNGFYGKDIRLTGSDESKRTTAENLERQLEITRDWIHKQKTVSYG